MQETTKNLVGPTGSKIILPAFCCCISRSSRCATRPWTVDRRHRTESTDKRTKHKSKDSRINNRGQDTSALDPRSLQRLFSYTQVTRNRIEPRTLRSARKPSSATFVGIPRRAYRGQGRCKLGRVRKRQRKQTAGKPANPR